MSIAFKQRSANAIGDLEYVSFYVGDLLIGVDIRQVEEINRQVEATHAPQSPDWVRGVINLRGNVVTVVDLRTILGVEQSEVTAASRNIVVNFQNEQIGLLVDRVADVVYARADEIEPPPANVSGVDGRFFTGVHKLESELLVVLDVDAALAVDASH